MYGSRGLGFVITRIEYVWNAVLTDPLPPAAKRARFDAARERERDCWRASFTTRVSLALFNNYSQGCRCVETVVSIHSGKTSPWQMEQMFWRDPLVRPGLLCHSNVTIDVNHWLDRHCWFIIRRCQHFSPSPGGGSAISFLKSRNPVDRGSIEENRKFNLSYSPYFRCDFDISI